MSNSLLDPICGTVSRNVTEEVINLYYQALGFAGMIVRDTPHEADLLHGYAGSMPCHTPAVRIWMKRTRRLTASMMRDSAAQLLMMMIDTSH